LVEDQRQRRYRRVPVGHDYTVRFSVNGEIHRHVPLTNLSAGGCFALVPKVLASNLHRGYLLMDFLLEHADLPKTSICSQVVHVIPQASKEGDERLGLGIAFLSTSPHFYATMDAHVAQLKP